MSTLDPAAIRARLEARAAELLTRDAALTTHLRQQDGRLDADFEDQVSFTAQDEVLERLDEAARAELEGIRGALERLAEGVYTTCVSCGGEIASGRLLAVPTARQCTACAAAAEGR